jgi:hypothetical protein
MVWSQKRNHNLTVKLINYISKVGFFLNIDICQPRKNRKQTKPTKIQTRNKCKISTLIVSTWYQLFHSLPFSCLFQLLPSFSRHFHFLSNLSFLCSSSSWIPTLYCFLHKDFIFLLFLSFFLQNIIWVTSRFFWGALVFLFICCFLLTE